MTFVTTHVFLFVSVGALILLSSVARTVHLKLFERHFHLTFADAPVRSLLYFSAWSVIVILIFPAQVRELFIQVTPTYYLLLIFIMFVVFPGIFHTTRKREGSPQWLLAFFPAQGILTLGERYILAKIADVVFQQLIAGVMILILFQAGVSYPAIVGIFIVLFASAHLYIFRTSGMFWGIYYTTYAALGGFVFTFLILFVPAGIMYAILIHMLFYVISGVLFASLPRPHKSLYHDISGTEPVLRVT